MDPVEEAVAEYQNIPELDVDVEIELAILILETVGEENLTDQHKERVMEAIGKK